MFPRNDEDMGRCLRIDVFERDDLVVLVNDLCRNFLRDDPAEETTWF